MARGKKRCITHKDETRVLRPRRENKQTSYKESSDDEDNRTKDSEQSKYYAPSNVKDTKWEPEEEDDSEDFIPLKSLVKKVSNRMSEGLVSKRNADRTIKSSTAYTANTFRLDLSEGESSGLSDDELTPLRCKLEGADSNKSYMEKKSSTKHSNFSEFVNTNSESIQMIKSDQDLIAESNDKKLLSLSTKLFNESDNSRAVSTAEQVVDDDMDMEDVDENKRIESRTVEEFEDKKIEAGDDNIFAKSSIQTRLKSMRNSLSKQIQVVSSEGSGSDGDMEELNDGNQRRKRGRKNPKVKVEASEQDVPLSSKRSTRRNCAMAKDEMSAVKDNDNMVDVGKVNRKTTQRKRQKENEDTNGDERMPLSALSAKLSDQKRRSTRLTKKLMDSELTCSDEDETTGNGEDLPQSRIETRKRKRKKDGEIDSQEMPLSAKLSYQKERSAKREEMTRETELSLSDGSESDENWEDVNEVKTKTKKLKVKKEQLECVGPIKGLEVSVEVDSIHTKKKRKSRQEKMFMWVRQMFHRIQKNMQIVLHKSHLLCLFANALNENKHCNNHIFKAICLSLIPNDYFQKLPKRWDIDDLRTFVAWFQTDIPQAEDLHSYFDKESLLEKFKIERLHVIVAMLRSLGFLCRIIFSLQPVTGKMKKSDLKADESTTSNSKTTVIKGSQKKTKNLKKKRGRGTSSYFDDEDDLDPDFKHKRTKNVPGSSTDKKEGGSMNGISNKVEQTCNNIWTEIFMDSVDRWVCLELVRESIDSPQTCEDIALKPLQYVIGIDNNQKVKDVTCRYAAKWLTVNRKLRVDRDWWARTLLPYKPSNDVINLREDAQLTTDLMGKDLPKTIGEFKDHPLYALQRHLLKFEALYPSSTVPVGYIRKEAIYPRDCIHVLHTRETWMKQARCVKGGEEPYKIVKGRKKFNERHLNKEVLTPIFGKWQTEIYVPPPVVDGKVPKNEYGNVELYKPSMLPEGAVHIPIANMQSVARKLNIDFAPAMMGWDFHSGFSHPIFEGIVVAKEYEDILHEAYIKHEEEKEAKEKKKREDAIYKNWQSLIKGLLIRARLKNQYSFEEDNQIDKGKLTKRRKTTKKVTTKYKVNKTLKAKGSDEDDEGGRSIYWPNKQMDGDVI